MEGPRLIRRREVPALSRLLIEVFGFDGIYEEAAFAKGLSRPVHLRGGIAVVEDGRPVSYVLHVVDQVSLYGCRLKVASIGGVCTDKAYRNRGYAGLVLAETIRVATAAGARVMIVSGNRGLYERNHCVPAGELLTASLSRETLPPADPGLSVHRFSVADWRALAPVNAAEPVRFVRPADFFARCCCWWDVSRPEVWTVSDARGPLAFLSLVPPWRSERRHTRTVFDYAGPRAALLNALPLVCHAAEIDAIGFRFPRQDRELAYLLSARGLALKPATLSGTHRLLNLPGLLRDLRPYLAARLPADQLRRLSFTQEGERCAIALGPERLDLDLSAAVTLVLGGKAAPSVAGELGEALRAIFPLPFPMPGFNYV